MSLRADRVARSGCALEVVGARRAGGREAVSRDADRSTGAVAVASATVAVARASPLDAAGQAGEAAAAVAVGLAARVRRSAADRRAVLSVAAATGSAAHRVRRTGGVGGRSVAGAGTAGRQRERRIASALRRARVGIHGVRPFRVGIGTARPSRLGVCLRAVVAGFDDHGAAAVRCGIGRRPHRNVLLGRASASAAEYERDACYERRVLPQGSFSVSSCAGAAKRRRALQRYARARDGFACRRCDRDADLDPCQISRNGRRHPDRKALSASPAPTPRRPSRRELAPHRPERRQADIRGRGRRTAEAGPDPRRSSACRRGARNARNSPRGHAVNRTVEAARCTAPLVTCRRGASPCPARNGSSRGRRGRRGR